MSTSAVKGRVQEKVNYVASTTFTMDKRYTDFKLVGKGSYGVVCSAMDANLGKKMAIKKITPMAKHADDAKHVLREIRLMRHMGKHENIISIEDLYVREAADELYIVMELMDSDLHRVIQSKQQLTDNHFRYFIFQLFCGVKYLHDNRIIHRDLKPGNLLVTRDCKLRITDFGLARERPTGRGVNPEDSIDSPMTEHVVTRWYRPPELMLCPDGLYSYSVDMWSCGCILGEMLGRNPMFPGKNFIHQLSLIFDVIGSPLNSETSHIRNSQARKFLDSQATKVKVPFLRFFPSASVDAIDLLESLLVFDPSRRLSAAEAVQSRYVAGLTKDSISMVYPETSTDFEFEFENSNPSKQQLKSLILKEVQVFNAEKNNQGAQTSENSRLEPTISKTNGSGANNSSSSGSSATSSGRSQSKPRAESHSLTSMTAHAGSTSTSTSTASNSAVRQGGADIPMQEAREKKAFTDNTSNTNNNNTNRSSSLASAATVSRQQGVSTKKIEEDWYNNKIMGVGGMGDPSSALDNFRPSAYESTASQGIRMDQNRRPQATYEAQDASSEIQERNEASYYSKGLHGKNTNVGKIDDTASKLSDYVSAMDIRDGRSGANNVTEKRHTQTTDQQLTGNAYYDRLYADTVNKYSESSSKSGSNSGSSSHHRYSNTVETKDADEEYRQDYRGNLAAKASAILGYPDLADIPLSPNRAKKSIIVTKNKTPPSSPKNMGSNMDTDIPLPPRSPSKSIRNPLGGGSGTGGHGTGSKYPVHYSSKKVKSDFDFESDSDAEQDEVIVQGVAHKRNREREDADIPLPPNHRDTRTMRQPYDPDLNATSQAKKKKITVPKSPRFSKMSWERRDVDAPPIPPARDAPLNYNSQPPMPGPRQGQDRNNRRTTMGGDEADPVGPGGASRLFRPTASSMARRTSSAPRGSMI